MAGVVPASVPPNSAQQVQTPGVGKSSVRPSLQLPAAVGEANRGREQARGGVHAERQSPNGVPGRLQKSGRGKAVGGEEGTGGSEDIPRWVSPGPGLNATAAGNRHARCARVHRAVAAPQGRW